MSTKFNQNAVSNISSVLSSIENDRQVYHWFLMLISLPQVQQNLLGINKAKEEYKNLKNIQIIEITTYVILALIATAAYILKQPLVLLLSILPLLFIVKLFQKNRKCVAAISEQFLLINMLPEDLNKQTLYQICENFSQQYNIPSLIDIITAQDFIGRKVLLATILTLPFLHPFTSWQLLIIPFIVFSVCLAILNTSAVLKRLK